MNPRLVIKRLALDSLYYSGANRLLEPVFGGVGCILCFHRVLPSADHSFSSPHIVDTRFFEEMVSGLRARGYALVTISEVYRRLVERDLATRFACLTFDDGYRDNHDHAWTICQRYDAPMTIYLTSGFIDREMPVWWIELESLVRQRSRISFELQGKEYSYQTSTPAQKSVALRALNALFVSLGPESRLLLAGILSDDSGVKFGALSDDAMLSWETIRSMVKSGQVEFGAHTVTHPCLSSENEDTVRAEVNDGRRRLEEQIGRPVAHFAYPFGKRPHAGRREFELVQKSGFATAVTGRVGCLMAEHREHLSCLPRIPVDGRLPTPGAVEAVLSGTLAAIVSGLTRIVTD
jgi:peptidoglycan/xylan/chitin deacetylase (PgdA/CDA1 family)